MSEAAITETEATAEPIEAADVAPADRPLCNPDDPLSVRDLFEAGVHFGHQTKRWNPKMRPYLYGARNGIHIIDLDQSVQLFRRAFAFACCNWRTSSPCRFRPPDESDSASVLLRSR